MSEWIVYVGRYVVDPEATGRPKPVGFAHAVRLDRKDVAVGVTVPAFISGPEAIGIVAKLLAAKIYPLDARPILTATYEPSANGLVAMLTQEMERLRAAEAKR